MVEAQAKVEAKAQPEGQNITGTAYVDKLTGGDDTINGGAGDDTLEGVTGSKGEPAPIASSSPRPARVSEATMSATSPMARTRST